MYTVLPKTKLKLAIEQLFFLSEKSRQVLKKETWMKKSKKGVLE
jgi:hypothetical protein